MRTDLVEQWLKQSHKLPTAVEHIAKSEDPSDSFSQQALQSFMARSGATREQRAPYGREYPINIPGLGTLLDVVSRPLYGIANMLDDMMGTARLGEELLGAPQAFWEGFSGQRRMWFSDLTHGFMSDSTPGWVKSMAGFAGDVFLDPATYTKLGALTKVGRLSKKVGRGATAVASKAAKGHTVTLAPEVAGVTVRSADSLKHVSRHINVRDILENISIINHKNLDSIADAQRMMSNLSQSLLKEAGVSPTSKLAKEVINYLTDPKSWDLHGGPAQAFDALTTAATRGEAFAKGQRGLMTFAGKKVKGVEHLERLLFSTPEHASKIQPVIDAFARNPQFQQLTSVLNRGFNTMDKVTPYLKDVMVKHNFLKNARHSVKMNTPREIFGNIRGASKVFVKDGTLPKDFNLNALIFDFVETPTWIPERLPAPAIKKESTRQIDAILKKTTDIGTLEYASPSRVTQIDRMLTAGKRIDEYKLGRHVIDPKKPGMEARRQSVAQMMERTIRNRRELMEMTDNVDLDYLYKHFPSQIDPKGQVAHKVTRAGETITTYRPRTLLDDYKLVTEHPKMGKTVKDTIDQIRHHNRQLLKLEQELGMPVTELSEEFLHYMPRLLTRESRKILEKHKVLQQLYIDEIRDIAASTKHRSMKERTLTQNIQHFADRRVAKLNELSTSGKPGSLSKHLGIDDYKLRDTKGKMVPMGDGGKAQLKKALDEIQQLNIRLYEDDPAIAMAYRTMRHETSVQAHQHLDEIVKLYGKHRNTFPKKGVRKIGEGSEAYSTLSHYLPDWAGGQKVTYKTLPSKLKSKYGRFSEYAFPEEITDYLINLEQKMSTAQTPQWLEYYDKYFNTWKQWLLFPIPGFHVRNVVDNTWKMYLHGVSPDSFADVTEFYLDMQRKTGVVKQTARGVDFTASKLMDLAKDSGVVGSGFMASHMSSAIEDMVRSPAKLQGAVTKMAKVSPHKVIQLGGAAGTAVEDFFRMTVFWDGLKKGLRTEDAMQGVAKTLFNYADITTFEKSVLKRLFPFYAFMRKNTPFHLEQLATQPGRVGQLGKAKVAVEGMTEPHPERLLSDWLQGPFTVRTPFRDDAGNPKYANLEYWLSTMNLAGLMTPSETFPTLFNAMTPVIKTPISLIANYDPFTREPIERWEGHKRELLGIDIPAKVEHTLRGAVPGGRLAYEMHRLNPANIFGDRPWQPSGFQRATGFATGFRTYSHDPQRAIAVDRQRIEQQIQELQQKMQQASMQGDATVLKELQQEFQNLISQWPDFPAQ